MKKIIIAAAAALVGLTSCSNQDETKIVIDRYFGGDLVERDTIPATANYYRLRVGDSVEVYSKKAAHVITVKRVK